MRKKLVIVALVCFMLSIVGADRNKTEDNSTKNAKDNHECISEITTTIKLPLFIRLFGKKPLRFIKKSICKILGKNFTFMKKHSNQSHSTLKIHKVQQAETSANIFTSRNISFTASAGDYTKINSTERQTPKSGSWGRKALNDGSYYRRFVYTPERYVSSVKVRKYYTPGGSPYTQETAKKSTSKVNSNNEDIRIFTTAPIFKESTSKAKSASEELIESSAKNSNGGKRQRRCSVDDSSESEPGYTYLLRKKRPQSTFNPYAYLTKLSKKPVFTGGYTPRRYTYSTVPAATTTRSTSPKAPITTKPKTFLRTLPKLTTTTTTTASPKPTFQSTIRQWSRRYTFNTRTSQAIATSTVAPVETKLTREGTTQQTRAKHFWVNNWNLRYMSYYMNPKNHTYRTYQPPITTSNPSPRIKTTRAMYYLSQYWNKGYFSYYTNFDPPDESSHAFAKRLGYFPDATTRFKKIRMMPKRFRPEGFIDLFSLESFLRDLSKRLEANQTYPPPHERESISSSVEDVSYWFFFNNSVTSVPWKNKLRPTMKPIPSYFFRDSMVTRYYPPSHEQNLQKAVTILKKFQKTRSTASTSKPKLTDCWFFLHTSTTPSTAVHTSRPTARLPHIRTYESKIRTSIPTFPTNKETTPPNIDPFGLLNKIMQYNARIKQPLSRDSNNIHQSTLHPVNELPGILKLPFSLSPNMMMYTDFPGKQLFTLLGKYHVHKDNKTLECVQNPSEFLNPLKVVAPPPQSGYYRIIQRHRIRDGAVEKNPAQISNVDISDLKGHRKLLPGDRTVAVEIRFYPLRSTGTIKTWNEYLGSQKNKFSMAVLPTRSASSAPTR